MENSDKKADKAFEAWIAETVRREAVPKETQSEQELFDKISAEAKRRGLSMNDYGSA
mgnify:CR=1 FL=1